MAQYENHWRDDARNWRNERDQNRDRDWDRSEGRRYGGYDPDDYIAGGRNTGGRTDWQGERATYRGQDYRGQDYRGVDDRGSGYRDQAGRGYRSDRGPDYESREYGGRAGEGSGRFGHDSWGRDTRGHDTARESERMYDRTFGGYEGARTAGTEGDYGNRDYGGRDYGGRMYPGGERGYGARDYGGRDRDVWEERNRDSGRFRDDGRSRAYGGYGEPSGEVRRGQPRDRGFWEQAGDEIASWFGDEDAERRRHQDEVRAAEHRGRGPRGYSRSDDRVREDVNDRLTDDAYLDASDIEVSVSNGEVTLGGMVQTRSAKRRAEDVAESVSGVTHVQNNLRVRPQTGETGSGGTWGRSTGAGASAMANAGGTGAVGGSGTGTHGSGTAAGATGGLGTTTGTNSPTGSGAGASGGPAAASAGGNRSDAARG